PGISIILLFSNLVHTHLMVAPLKKFGVMFFWMGVAAGSVILADSFFELPDEVSGVLYFISIGLAASGTLNYYR
ncbi:MAG: hypothetical protein QF769_06910, partial [Candidatus Marinimicrobia bacterium]|nr:hypothetical protein [Candidatus Neomarinimicrobiota bacterium]